MVGKINFFEGSELAFSKVFFFFNQSYLPCILIIFAV